MNGYDITLGLLLAWSTYRGIRAGIALQVAGIVGVIAGVWLAFRLCRGVARLFGSTDMAMQVAAFLLLLVGVLLTLALVGRALRGGLRLAGLGPLDRLGGGLLGGLKMALMLGALLTAFEPINRTNHWVNRASQEESLLYGPISRLAQAAYPYIYRLLESDPSRSTPRGQISPNSTTSTHAKRWISICAALSKSTAKPFVLCILPTEPPQCAAHTRLSPRTLICIPHV